MNNIKEARKQMHMSQARLSEIIGVSRSAVAMWEASGTQPDNTTLIALSKALHKSIDYLLGNHVHNSSFGIRVPVIGISAAGIPICEVQEYIDDTDADTWEEISANLAATGDFVAIRIKGDSMQPRIMDGDIVIVQVQETAETGDTVIAFINGDEATCKKIKIRPEGVILMPNNPAYEPMFYTKMEVETLPVRIYGKVVEIRGKP